MSARASDTPAWFSAWEQFAPVGESSLASQHLDGAHLAEIRISPAAVATYAALVNGSRFENGTVIVERLRPRPTSTADVVLALERRDGAWLYWQLDGEGHGAELGAGNPCQGCHAGAVAAPVFGTPRPSAPRESKTEKPRSSK